MGVVSRLTVAVTGAATTILVARLLGAEGSGSFAIALTVILMLTVGGTLGTQHGIAYFVSAGTWAQRDALASAQGMAFAVGTVLALVALGVRTAFPSAFGDLSVGETAIVVAAVPFSLSWLYVSFIALSTDQYEAFVLPPAVQSASAMVFVTALAPGSDVEGAIVGLTASHVVAAVGAGAWAQRRLPAGGPRAERRQLRRAITFGLKGYAANALQMLNTRVDLFILSAVASTAIVGQYAVALAVATVLWLVPQALGDVLFPRVAALSQSEAADAGERRSFVETKSLRHAVIVVAASALVLAAALVLLVVPVYGEEFEPAIEMGLIMLPGVALLGIGNILGATIVGRGRPEYSLYTALVSTPVSLALYAVLVPALLGEGAALAKSISFTLTFVLLLVFYVRLVEGTSLRSFVPTGSELRDYRALPRAIRDWAGGRRSCAS
jgi:O-antigen/teichoic acid export membrane protein